MQQTSRPRAAVLVVLAVVAGLVGMTAPAQAATTVVRPDALNGWSIDNFDAGALPPDSTGDAPTSGGTNSTFVVGPAGAPIGDGSIRQAVGAQGDDLSRLQTGQFNGTALAALTDISYSTHVTNYVSGQATYLQLYVDTNADGLFLQPVDDILVFEPVYQTGTYAGDPVPNQCVGIAFCADLGVWQTWDVDAGGFWSSNEMNFGPPLTTLANYAAANPGAVLATDVPAVRLTAGGGDGAWDNFDGNVDNLTINGDTFDFDPIPLAVPTVHIEDGGDLFLNASEVGAGVMVSGTYDNSNPLLDGVIVRIVNDPGCGNVPPGSGTSTAAATLNPDGTWTAGPFNLSSDPVFAQGVAVCARARAQESSTGRSSDVGTSDNQPVKDTVAPATPTAAISHDPITAANQTAIDVAGTADAGTDVSVELSDGTDTLTASPASTGTYTHTFDTTSLADGTITATVTSTDVAGNESAPATDTSLKDATADLATIDLLDTDGLVNAAEAAAGVPVSWEVDGAGPPVTISARNVGSAAPANCVYASQPRGPVTGAIQPLCFLDLAEGPIEVLVEGVDGVGNPASATDTSTLDRIAPAVPTAVISPDPVGASTQTAVEVSGDAETDSVVDISITDGITTLTDQDVANSPYSVVFDITGFVDGPISATATATDPAGNASSAGGATATLDTIAPSAPAVVFDTDPITQANQTATGLSGTAEASSWIAGSVSDGVSSVPFGPTQADGAGLWSTTLDATSLADGTLLATAQATDAAGNVSSDGTATAIKDATGPLAGTLTIDDGDGFMNAAETASGIPATWENAAAGPDAVSASVWFEDSAGGIPSGCGPFGVGPSGTGSVNATCAANLPEGQFDFVGVWFDALGNASVEALDSSIKDSVAPPAGTIDLLDLDGTVGDDEALGGVTATYSLPGTGPGATVTVANTASPAPGACVFSGLPRTGSVVVTPACFDALADGGITVALDGTDAAGNPAPTATDTSTLLRSRATLVIVDDTDPAGAAPDTAGRSETKNGEQLKVRVDLNPQTVGTIVGTVKVRDSLGNEITSAPRAISTASSEVSRTFMFDVRSFANGPVTAEGSFSDGGGPVVTTPDATNLDLDVPGGSWTTSDGDQFVRLNLFFFVVTSGSLEGTASDATSPVQFVYATGRNLDDPGTRYSDHCDLSAPGALAVTFECGIESMTPGEWEVTFRVQDEAGNVYDAPPIRVFVDGTPI